MFSRDVNSLFMNKLQIVFFLKRGKKENVPSWKPTQVSALEGLRGVSIRMGRKLRDSQQAATDSPGSSFQRVVEAEAR